jgi:glycine dehydrogenase
MTKPANATFDSGNFSRRHIGIAPHDVGAMLETVDAKSLDDLIDQTIPASIRQHRALAIGPGLSESEVLRKLRRTATKNKVAVSLIGQGYYGTILPPVIQRNILENPAWYTAYTPYQPEISQGRLEALLNFQTMVADLTDLPIANASLLDEATAAAEAMAMAHRLGRNGKTTFFIDADCHPQTIAVVRPANHLGLACGGSTRNSRRRSAGTGAAGAAGGHWRRHRHRLDAALWRPHGLWRPARGLYRDQG